MPAMSPTRQSWLACGLMLGLVIAAPPIAAKKLDDPKKEQVKKLFDNGMIQYDLSKFD